MVGSFITKRNNRRNRSLEAKWIFHVHYKLRNLKNFGIEHQKYQYLLISNESFGFDQIFNIIIYVILYFVLRIYPSWLTSEKF